MKKISLLLIPLTILALFSIGIALAASGPELVIPSNIPAQANHYVDVPVQFNSNGTLVSNITFSIEYNTTWLDFDDTDPDAITFSLPADFGSSDCWEAVTGEIQCIVSPGLQPELPTLPDGVFLTIRLQTLNAPDGTTAEVTFADNPIASFGGPDGQAVQDGSTTDGSVYFGEIIWKVFLPLIIKQTPIPTTVTPTPVPTTETPTPIPTTETPVPTEPTDTPSPTPTDEPGCSNIILNGGFEEGETDWYIPITNYPANVVTGVKYLGEKSLRTGINVAADVGSYSSGWQQISIPNDAVSADLTFYFKPQTEEPLALRLLSGVINQISGSYEINYDYPPLYDSQFVAILNLDQSVSSILMDDLSNSRVWTEFNANLMGYRGHTVWLYFATLNNGDGQRTAMYVDEVSLEICH